MSLANTEHLLQIMKRLRDPKSGCPWDLEQDFSTIAPHTIEEAYEVADAIENNDMKALPGELGDLLLQVVFHSQMADEKGLFDFEQVASSICEKLIVRHPHIFGEKEVGSADEVVETWESIKASERKEQGASGILDGVAVGLPATTRAVKLQKRAAKAGFDWKELAPVLDKVQEEIQELKEELPVEGNEQRVEEELGDLLFAICNLARHLKIDPERALRRANEKFLRRFRGMEALTSQFSEMSQDQLEALWRQVKLKEKGEGA